MGIDMMALMHGGVSDIRLSGAPRLSEENEREAGPYCTRVFSVIGPFHVDRYVDAVMAIVVEPVEVCPSQRVSIPPEHVLAQPWRYEQMVDALNLMRAGGATEPIQVNQIQIPGLPDMYSVVRGSHRAFAARELGVHEIPAEIATIYRCDVSAFCIQGNVLMREVGGERWPVSKAQPWGLPVCPADAVITPDYIYILQGLGIRILPPSDQPSFDMSLAMAVARKMMPTQV